MVSECDYRHTQRKRVFMVAYSVTWKYVETEIVYSYI